MIRTRSLYEACRELFIRYPLAARADNRNWAIHSMVLMLQERNDVRFFVVSQDCDTGRPRYSCHPWHGGCAADIEADNGDAVPQMFVKAVGNGIPIPQDGSLLGWRYGDVVTALIAVYADPTPEHPEPCWSVMPFAGIPETQWPPFASEHLFGQWFWEHYWAGNIVSLGALIARIPDTVFWVDTEAILGSGCCVVSRDIKSPGGYTLRRGRYVYHQVLRAGGPVPSLDVLLDDNGKIDLASRF